MPTPNAKSGAEYRLERIHDEDKGMPTAEEQIDADVRASEALARLLSDHPHISMSKREVLEACDYEFGALRDNAAELFPDKFGGEAGA